MEFKDKFIGFVDVLGFKKLVEAAENGTGMPLSELMELLRNLGSMEDVVQFKKYGPITCPQSAYIQRDLNFILTQVSDCVIVSSEVSPAGSINLVNHCWKAVIKLLQKGIMCRGYITKGLIYHTDTRFVGSGYHKACAKEKEVAAFKREADERGTPFVEVDPVVCNYIKNSEDECVNKMFSGFVKQDREITALFPFKMLSHSFAIRNNFKPEEERNSNNNLRQGIKIFMDRIRGYVDESNPDAVKKAQHYFEALDAQLSICDETDEFINTIHFSC